MKNLSRQLLHVGAGLAFALVALHSPAADFPSSGPVADNLAAARKQIAEKNWPAAIDELKSANDTGSADWNNLMGYSLRKAKTPDYAAAERFYDTALRIDPAHLGALEYSGELYLMTNNLPKAEIRLATLEHACKAACEEYADLKKAVARFKANGNKTLAQ